MKKISCKISFILCLWPWCIFYNKEKHSDILLNRKLIFLEQEKELLFIGFYLWFILEYIVRFLKTLSFRCAYVNMSFVQEVEFGESDLDYVINRHHYDWSKWLLY